MYVRLLVCYLNKLQNARCNDKDGVYHVSLRQKHHLATFSTKVKKKKQVHWRHENSSLELSH